MATARFTLSDRADVAASIVAVDEDEHPVEDLTILIAALWAKGDLDGPSMPTVYVTHDYDLVATAEVPGTPFSTTVCTDQYGWDELSLRDDERRQPEDLAQAVRSIVRALNSALDQLDAFTVRQREEVEFAKIAAAFEDPTGVDDMVFTPLAAHVALVGDALLGLLAAVEQGRDEDENPDEAEWVGLTLSAEQIQTYLDSLGEDDEEDARLGRHLRAVAAQLSITETLLEDYSVNADHDPRVVIGTIGHILDVATTLDVVALERANAETVTVLYDRVWNARSFRIASYLRIGDSGTTLVTDRLPTSILTASSAPTVSLRILHGVEVAIAALDSALEDLRDHLTQRFVFEGLDGRGDTERVAA